MWYKVCSAHLPSSACFLPLLKIHRSATDDFYLHQTNLGHGLTLWLNWICTLSCWKGSFLLPLNYSALLPSPKSGLLTGYWHASNGTINCWNLLTRKQTNRKTHNSFFSHWDRFKSAHVRPDKCLNMLKQAAEAREGREGKPHFNSAKLLICCSPPLWNHALMFWM